MQPVSYSSNANLTLSQDLGKKPDLKWLKGRGQISQSRGYHGKSILPRPCKMPEIKGRGLEHVYPIQSDGMGRCPQGEAVLQITWSCVMYSFKGNNQLLEPYLEVNLEVN